MDFYRKITGQRYTKGLKGDEEKHKLKVRKHKEGKEKIN